MLPEQDVIRIRHILDASRKATGLVGDRTREALEDDEVLPLAIVRLVEIIGEAARHVSPETRAMIAQIPWRQMAGTRDRLIHAYADVDMDIIWTIVTRELPSLVRIPEHVLDDGDAG